MTGASELKVGSLVLYKEHPALVIQIGEKIEIETPDGSRLKVRVKDLELLHPGPLQSLAALKPLEGSAEETWEVLGEESGEFSLQSLAELAFGEFTPSSAWSAWRWIEDGLYFQGSLQALKVRPREAVVQTNATRQAKIAVAQAWNDFLDRARSGQPDPVKDSHSLREVEDVALGRRSASRVLQTLGHAARPETAHGLLLKWKTWDEQMNPYPLRLGLPVNAPQISLPPLAEEARLDLTGLPAYAIDDRGSSDPDDALSLERCQLGSDGRWLSGRLWVHIADAAALIKPDSPADLEGRARGATLYLPEGKAPMLPDEAVQKLGLGLNERSPALSFGIEVDDIGRIAGLEIHPSWIKVSRLSYEEAEGRLEQAPFNGLRQFARLYQARRMANQALLIELPEVIMHVLEGRVEIRPLLRLESRELVRESMLLAGEAAANFAVLHELPFPYAIQEAPDTPVLPVNPADLAGAFAQRRAQRRAQVSSLPGMHSGVGLPAYSRATSPLRRYLDLVAHQQLRAFLLGDPVLDTQAMLERVGAADAVTGSVAQAEYQSRRHWSLVYLLQNPGWRGQAVLVEKRGASGKAIIPDLGFDTTLSLRGDLPLNTRLELTFEGASLPELEGRFSMRVI
jgi:exoribonuclease-2